MQLSLMHNSAKGLHRDIGVMVTPPYGFYFAIGRLDGGFDLRLGTWSIMCQNSGLTFQVHFGPFDLMWIKNG